MAPAKFTANVACLGNGLTGCLPYRLASLTLFLNDPKFCTIV